MLVAVVLYTHPPAKKHNLEKTLPNRLPLTTHEQPQSVSEFRAHSKFVLKPNIYIHCKSTMQYSDQQYASSMAEDIQKGSFTDNAKCIITLRQKLCKNVSVG